MATNRTGQFSESLKAAGWFSSDAEIAGWFSSDLLSVTSGSDTTGTGAATARKATSSASGTEVYTINDVTGFSAVEMVDNLIGQYTEFGSTYQFSIYAYKVIGATQIYSNAGADASFSDNFAGDNFFIRLAWAAVPGATGYRVVVQNDSYASLPAYFDVTGGSVVTVDIGITAVTYVESPVNSLYTSGTPTLTPKTADPNNTGTGSATAKKATSSATGTERFSATASASANKATSSATASQRFSATAVATANKATSTASGSERFSATASNTARPATGSASGSEIFTATAAGSASRATSSASGSTASSSTTGTGSATANKATSTATGFEVFSATATATANKATSTASGSETFTATASATANKAVSAASGSERFVATASGTAKAATSNAIGGDGSVLNITGTGDAIAHAATGYALGQVLVPISQLGTLTADKFYGMPESLPARKIITGSGRAVAKSATSQAKGIQRKYHNSVGVAVAASARGGGSGRQNFDRLNDEELLLILS